MGGRSHRLRHGNIVVVHSSPHMFPFRLIMSVDSLLYHFAEALFLSPIKTGMKSHLPVLQYDGILARGEGPSTHREWMGSFASTLDWSREVKLGRPSVLQVKAPGRTSFVCDDGSDMGRAVQNRARPCAYLLRGMTLRETSAIKKRVGASAAATTTATATAAGARSKIPHASVFSRAPGSEVSTDCSMPWP